MGSQNHIGSKHQPPQRLLKINVVCALISSSSWNTQEHLPYIDIKCSGLLDVLENVWSPFSGDVAKHPSANTIHPASSHQQNNSLVIMDNFLGPSSFLKK